MIYLLNSSAMSFVLDQLQSRTQISGTHEVICWCNHSAQTTGGTTDVWTGMAAKVEHVDYDNTEFLYDM